MTAKIDTPEVYIDLLPTDRQEAFEKLRQSIKANLPAGFEETIQYGMITYVVPLSVYPQGYHASNKPILPLPFISIASQKNFIALYHMGIYSIPDLLHWFTQAYPAHTKNKLDMGKSCIRFKKPDQIPYKLVGELVSKITVEEWIKAYEKFRK